MKNIKWPVPFSFMAIGGFLAGYIACLIFSTGYNEKLFSVIGLLVSSLAMGGAVWAAIAAVRSADLARESLHSDRAWVMCNGVRVVEIIEDADKKSISIEVEWKNSGHSPALECRYGGAFMFCAADLGRPQFPPDFPVESVGCLAPGSQRFPKIDTSHADDIARYFAGDCLLYACVRAEYRDVYSHELRHSRSIVEIRMSNSNREGPGASFSTSIVEEQAS